MHIKFIQKLINIVRKRIIPEIDNIIIKNRIKINFENLSKKNVIKVAFLKMYATECQDLPVFEAMLQDELFDPYFIINPDIYRSKENFDFNYERAKNELTKKYGKERVLDGYNYDTNEFIDYTNDFDMLSISNPYDHMAHKYFKIRYWRKKGIPGIYSNYAYAGRTKSEKHIFSIPETKLIWKMFVENEFSKKMIMSCGIDKKNIEVSGYAKLDKLKNIKVIERARKKIMIAPHHTIIPGDLNIGSFLKYYDLILRLPKMYSDIDFIFRPHPLLIENLKNIVWGGVKTDEYLNELTQNKNVEYQLSGEYLDTFVNSDALIHDCGSFLAEYLYTEHPQCIMFKGKEVINQEYSDFGKEMLEHTYNAFEEKQIIDFIENVVLKGNDYKKQERIKFADEKIKINYPNVTQVIIDIIKKETGH